jgi:hypothetical protein
MPPRRAERFRVDAPRAPAQSRGAMLVLNALVPVFLLIALGAWMQKASFVSASFLREANRVTYWLGLPALLFSQLVHSLHGAAGAERLLGAMGVVLALSLAVGYAVALLLRVPGPAVGTFVQGAFRGNLAFVGLPIVLALPDVPVLGGMKLHAAAVLVVAPTMVVYNLGAVIVLVASQHAFGWKSATPVLRQLAVTPPLLATLAGMAFAALGWTLPRSLDQTLAALGEMALPLGLLGVGGALVTARVGQSWKAPLGSALVKTAAGPVLAWLAGRWVGLGAVETNLLMILSAAPTAVVSYTMAVELKGDEQLASATIVASVVTSLGALAACVALFPA